MPIRGTRSRSTYQWAGVSGQEPDTHTHTHTEETTHNTKVSFQIPREKNKRGRKRTYRSKSKTINRMAIKTHISIITLNVHGLDAPTKRHRLAE